MRREIGALRFHWNLTRRMGLPTDVHELLFELAPRSGSPVPQHRPAQQFLRRLSGVPSTPEAAVYYSRDRCDELAQREGVHLKSDLRRCGMRNSRSVPDTASSKPLCHSTSAQFVGGRPVGTRALPTDLGEKLR